MEFFKLSRSKFIKLMLLCLFVSRCSMLEPFVDRRREAGAKTMETLYVGQSKPNAPAICYNKLTTDFATIQQMADDECRKHKTGNRAVLTKETLFTCRLFLPNHIYFKCEQ